MKKLSKLPYLQNIVSAWQSQTGEASYLGYSGDQYRAFLKTFGFKVPIDGNYLEFPDDFPEDSLLLFQMRWS